MIGYFCKYAPIEALTACGAKTAILAPTAYNFSCAEALMHPNMCSFTKAVLEDFEARPLEGMLFTSCCDSSRRLIDVLRHRYPNRFFYCLDLPRKLCDHSIRLYAAQIREMVSAYEQYSGSTFSCELLSRICDEKSRGINVSSDQCKAFRQGGDAGKRPLFDSERSKHTHPRIIMAGARPDASLIRLIESKGVRIVMNMCCTAAERDFKFSPDPTLFEYARALLLQLPCMRMDDTDRRWQLLSGGIAADGIIYHSVKFCDIYSFEYARLLSETKKRGLTVPILHIETDFATQNGGQLLTRVEAFLESLTPAAHAAFSSSDKEGQNPDPAHPECLQNENQNQSDPVYNHNQLSDGFAGGYVLGIDSGSTSTNAVIMDRFRRIIASCSVPTGAKSAQSAECALCLILKQAGIAREDLSQIVSTGYGRVSIPFSTLNLTEISAHAKGASYVNPNARTILDIGGQDSKAVRFNERGEVMDFVMNNKCAAGTGRFLEMMARTLDMDISMLGPLSLQYNEEIEISSMCSVFAESEVISLIAQNKETADIAHGICRAVAKRSLSLLKQVGIEPDIMVTGGVAKNPGLIKALEAELGCRVLSSENPEITGAIGAALFGLES